MAFGIYLENKKFPWQIIRQDNFSIWIKGNIIINNSILKNDEIIQISHELVNEEKNEDILQSLNGSYSLVIETPEKILAVVDRLRSIPLFYYQKDDDFVISDDANYLREKFSPSFNEEAGAEFLVTGYVTGNETLFKYIYQIRAGEYFIYNKSDGSLKTYYYHRYLHGNYLSEPDEVLLSRLDDIMLRVFQRLIDTAEGEQLVVPLSGGLDSRIIVAMLKRLGVKDVICFSYGRKGNYEAEISRQVAEAVGYQWYFIEYTKEKMYNWYNSDEMKEYSDYAGNLTSLPHIQDYFAVKELKEKGLISEKAVFVPGHSGDMLAGSWIPNEDLSNFTNMYMFIEHTLNRHYSLQDLDNIKNEQILSIFHTRIQNSIMSLKIDDIDTCIDAIELFNFNERQAKFIVNSIRAYEFFGYKWRIPLWDNELIEFFLKIKINYRINQHLYKKYINNLLIFHHFPELINIPTTNVEKKSPSIKFWIIEKLKKQPLKKYSVYFYNHYKKQTEYFLNPMNYYGIMSKKEYSKFFQKIFNINSFLADQFIKNIQRNFDHES